MKPSLHTTAYSDVSTLPVYAVRRASDGYFLDQEGEFQELLGAGNINTDSVDRRTSPDHWERNGMNMEGCEVVALAIVTIVTAVPVTW